MFFVLTAAALFQTLSVFAQSVTSSAPESEATTDDGGVRYGQGYVDPIGEYDVPSGLQAILASNDSRWTYPTAFTRNIVPKPLHSHNDYWRDAPYYSALSVGAISVEADIWLINGTLYVGHEASALTAERTLQSLYLDPIMDTLKRQNPSTPFAPGVTHNGVFDTTSDQTLYLWFDCKTDGQTTFQAAIEALEPLRAAGFLTTYSQSTGVTHGAVTVTGTGNTPASFFDDPSVDRWYFFDAKLTELGPSGSQSNITSDVTQIASVDFAVAIGAVGQNGTDAIFTSTQVSSLRSQIATAKAKGIGARYWDTPGWPVRVRNVVWKRLYEEGVALINVDDLQAAAFTEW